MFTHATQFLYRIETKQKQKHSSHGKLTDKAKYYIHTRLLPTNIHSLQAEMETFFKLPNKPTASAPIPSVPSPDHTQRPCAHAQPPPLLPSLV